MRASKLINLFTTFSKEEIKKFDEFVSSPYFNKNTNLLKLFRYIKKYSGNYESVKLEKEEAYSEIFPDRKYNDKVMKNLMSGLLGLGERFLGQTNYEKQSNDGYAYLLGELLQRKLYKNFSRNLFLAEDSLNKSGISEENYYNILNINEFKHSYELRTNPGTERVIDMKNVFEPLFCFFVMYFFKANSSLKNRQLSYNFRYDFSEDIEFTENLIKYIKQKSFKSEPILLIYYNMLMTYISENDFYFNEFRNLVNKHFELFNRKEKRNFHLAMESYCLRKSTKGSVTYTKKNFEVHKEMLHHNTYSYDQSNNILPLVFKNFVKVGIMVKEFDWTTKFIEEYKNKLTSGYDDNIYCFSYSYLYFKKGDYDKSLEYLSKVNYEDVYDKLNVKALLIQLYYEMNFGEELLSQIDTFKHFLLNDKKIDIEIKRIYSKFIYFVNKLIKLNEDFQNRYDIVSVKKELENSVIYDKDWLLEKIEEQLTEPVHT